MSIISALLPMPGTVAVRVTDERGIFVGTTHHGAGEIVDVPHVTANALFETGRAVLAIGLTPTPEMAKAKKLGLTLDEYERRQAAQVEAEKRRRPPTERVRVRAGKLIVHGLRTYQGGEELDLPVHLVENALYGELVEYLSGPTPTRAEIEARRIQACGTPEARRDQRTRELIQEALGAQATATAEAPAPRRGKEVRGLRRDRRTRDQDIDDSDDDGYEPARPQEPWVPSIAVRLERPLVLGGYTTPVGTITHFDPETAEELVESGDVVLHGSHAVRFMRDLGRSTRARGATGEEREVRRSTRDAAAVLPSAPAAVVSTPAPAAASAPQGVPVLFGADSWGPDGTIYRAGTRATLPADRAAALIASGVASAGGTGVASAPGSVSALMSRLAGYL